MSDETNYGNEEHFLAVRFVLNDGDQSAARRISRLIALGEMMKEVLAQFESGERTAEEISNGPASRETLAGILAEVLDPDPEEVEE